MKKIYLDTTIPSYLVARPSENIKVLYRQISTQDWWSDYRKYYDLYVSPMVFEECQQGDASLAKLRISLLDGLTILEENEDVKNLAHFYYDKLNFPKDSVEDAFHIAYAVYYGLEILLSWNNKHIANANVQSQLKKINFEKGYDTPILCTPDEVMEE